MSNTSKLAQWLTLAKTRPTQPMPPHIARAFMDLTLAEQGGEPQVEDLLPPWAGVAVARAKGIGLDLSPAGALFLTCLCDQPGALVMYVTVLRDHATKVGMTEIALRFPNGFYTEAALAELWDAQKIEGANLVDRITAEAFQ